MFIESQSRKCTLNRYEIHTLNRKFNILANIKESVTKKKKNRKCHPQLFSLLLQNFYFPIYMTSIFIFITAHSITITQIYF